MTDSQDTLDRRRLLQSVGAGTASTFLAGCRRLDAPAQKLGTVRIRNGGFEVRRDGEWTQLLVKGVNLGIAKPGYFPGQTAITREEYDRWFDQIAALGANAVRVYTVHPPAFYAALAAHNATADRPLYVLHGNWLPASRIEGETTAYEDEVTEFFDRGLRTVVDVVNGNATLDERAGYASGDFDVDVSPYVLGYVIGVEWEPRFVARTNDDHAGGATDGRFVESTPDASAFERWLAERLEALATYAATAYDHYRPVSFANWPTTDHLEHPAEPLEWEDQVSIDPNAVRTTDVFGPGTFATYHAYPYYPDFLSLSERYANYTDADGEANSYVGYLTDLVAANDHPVFVGEFGVPSSRGIAHEQVHGIDQGNHTERQQGKYDAALFESIVEAGTAGGAVFSWQDEWFKRTWNTMDYTDPSRRPFWLNVQSPEERFGLLSFDPAGRTTLSGTDGEWADATVVASGPASPAVSLDDGYDAQRSISAVEAMADAAFLNLRIRYDDLGEAIDWNRSRTVLALDTTPDRGNRQLARNLNLESRDGIDFLVELGGPSASRVRVASHYDRFYHEYGEGAGYLERAPYAERPDNGVYHPIRLATSHPLTVPNQDRTIPFDYVETGQLRYGTADPTADAFDSLADVHVDATANVVELRLPWLLLNFRDPSTRTILGDIWENGTNASERIERIGVGALTYAPDGEGQARPLSGDGNATDALPRANGSGVVETLPRFTWEEWHQPQYEERRKASYYLLQDAFERY